MAKVLAVSDVQTLLQPTSSLGSGKTISGVAASGGVVTVTATAHGFSTNDIVYQSGIGGAVEGNSIFVITKTTANAYTLNGLATVTAYTSGGSAQKLTVAGLLRNLKPSDLRNLLDYMQRRPDVSVAVNVEGTAGEPTLGTIHGV